MQGREVVVSKINQLNIQEKLGAVGPASSGFVCVGYVPSRPA
jgi:hypothetical protein